MLWPCRPQRPHVRGRFEAGGCGNSSSSSSVIGGTAIGEGGADDAGLGQDGRGHVMSLLSGAIQNGRILSIVFYCQDHSVK